MVTNLKRFLKISLLTAAVFGVFFLNAHASDAATEANEALQKGDQIAKQGRFSEAIAEFDKAIKTDANSSAAYHERASAYFQKGNIDQAIADYTKFIEINPASPPSFNPEYPWAYSAYHNRGLAYYKKGDTDKAIADFDKALELSTNSAEDYYYRGILRSAKKNAAESAEDLNKSWDILDRGIAYGYKPSKDLFDQLSKALGKSEAFDDFVLTGTPNYNYFNQCDETSVSKVAKGMSKEDVRKLAGGTKYDARPLTYRPAGGGMVSSSPQFTFSPNEDKSDDTTATFINIPPGINDFFITDKSVLIVRYNSEGKAIKVILLPKEQVLIKSS